MWFAATVCISVLLRDEQHGARISDWPVHCMHQSAYSSHEEDVVPAAKEHHSGANCCFLVENDDESGVGIVASLARSVVIKVLEGRPNLSLGL